MRQCSLPPDAPQKASAKNAVPMELTALLGVLAFCLSSFGFLMPGLHISLQQILVTVALAMAGLPVMLILVGWAMNKYAGHHVYWRNAVSLGWLLACVYMLTQISKGF